MEPMTTEQLASALAGTPSVAPAESIAETASDTPPTFAPTRPVDVLRTPLGDPFNVTLKDGRVVILQKPVRATSFLIARILGQQSANPTLDMYCKALMWVKNIGGLPMPTPNNMSMFEGIQEQLGDEGLEEVLMATIKHGETASSVADLKKS